MIWHPVAQIEVAEPAIREVQMNVFSSLVTERTARKPCRTCTEAHTDEFDYIENPRRRHSKSGYRNLMEFAARIMPA